MSKLRAPLRMKLDDLPSEEEIQRIWLRVQKRRARRQARRELRPAIWVGAGFVAACAVLLVLAWVRPASNTGPLTTGGHALAQVAGDATNAGLLELSDGSRIVVDPGARLEVLDNSSRAFGVALRTGRAAFDVRPGGPRRWTIEAGLATVEVVGTRFTVARTPGSVDVSVERGVVVVRGERVPDRVRKLTAGERLVVSEPHAARGTTEPAPPTEKEPVANAPAPTEAPAGEPRRPGPSSSGNAASVASATPLGFDELIAQADAARRRGDLRGAESLLESALAGAPDRKRAALAAFTLGKLELDGLGNASRAAAAFSRAVSLGPPDAIAEDALARLVEAEGAAGQIEKARADALEYQKRYPNGRRAYAVGRWLARP